MNDEILYRLVYAAKTICNSYCGISGISIVDLTCEDVELICNPNLQIFSFAKLKHVPNLMLFLVKELRYHLKIYNTQRQFRPIATDDLTVVIDEI